MRQLGLTVFALAWSCRPVAPDYAGRPCEPDGRCISAAYFCDPDTNRCMPAVASDSADPAGGDGPASGDDGTGSDLGPADAPTSGDPAAGDGLGPFPCPRDCAATGEICDPARGWCVGCRAATDCMTPPPGISPDCAVGSCDTATGSCVFAAVAAESPCDSGTSGSICLGMTCVSRNCAAPGCGADGVCQTVCGDSSCPADPDCGDPDGSLLACQRSASRSYLDPWLGDAASAGASCCGNDLNEHVIPFTHEAGAAVVVDRSLRACCAHSSKCVALGADGNAACFAQETERFVLPSSPKVEYLCDSNVWYPCTAGQLCTWVSARNDGYYMLCAYDETEGYGWRHPSVGDEGSVPVEAGLSHPDSWLVPAWTTWVSDNAMGCCQNSLDCAYRAGDGLPRCVADRTVFRRSGDAFELLCDAGKLRACGSASQGASDSLGRSFCTAAGGGTFEWRAVTGDADQSTCEELGGVWFDTWVGEYGTSGRCCGPSWNGEYPRDRSYLSSSGPPTSSAINDYACCDRESNCVAAGTCIPTGQRASAADEVLFGEAVVCSSGVWRGCDPRTNPCDSAAGHRCRREFGADDWFGQGPRDGPEAVTHATCPDFSGGACTATLDTSPDTIGCCLEASDCVRVADPGGCVASGTIDADAPERLCYDRVWFPCNASHLDRTLAGWRCANPTVGQYEWM